MAQLDCAHQWTLLAWSGVYLCDKPQLPFYELSFWYRKREGEGEKTLSQKQSQTLAAHCEFYFLACKALILWHQRKAARLIWERLKKHMDIFSTKITYSQHFSFRKKELSKKHISFFIWYMLKYIQANVFISIKASYLFCFQGSRIIACLLQNLFWQQKDGQCVYHHKQSAYSDYLNVQLSFLPLLV